MSLTCSRFSPRLVIYIFYKVPSWQVPNHIQFWDSHTDVTTFTLSGMELVGSGNRLLEFRSLLHTLFVNVTVDNLFLTRLHHLWNKDLEATKVFWVDPHEDLRTMLSTKYWLNLNHVHSKVLVEACATSIYYLLRYVLLWFNYSSRVHQRFHLPGEMQVNCGIQISFGDP